jgi:type II restriction enzyme
MSKIEQAQEILGGLGLPAAQQNVMSALTLLALCDIGPRSPWSAAKRRSMTVTKDIMAFVKARYGHDYAPNTRETFRRHVLHQFVQGHVADYNPDDPSLPTNSPHAHYAVSKAALRVVQSCGTRRWKTACARFASQQGSLARTYRQERARALTPLRLPDGRRLKLSPGKHNRLQAAIANSFGPRFAPGAKVLYLGDTANKKLILDVKGFAKLGVAVSDHGKLPDVVLHDKRRGWLFLIEAVTSHGPMSPKRVFELKALFAESSAGLVFVSAFPNSAEFHRHGDIAWDTEIWLAEEPDHMIHYNGDRFVGPRS